MEDTFTGKSVLTRPSRCHIPEDGSRLVCHYLQYIASRGGVIKKNDMLDIFKEVAVD
jgi:hypothetical protein